MTTNNPVDAEALQKRLAEAEAEIADLKRKRRSKTPKEDKDEWRSPPFVHGFLARTFDFDIDLAATAQNALCPAFLTKQQNALTLPWHLAGRVGWINPPYSNIDPWLAKARNEAVLGFTSVFLIPAPNGEDRYDTHVFDIASELWDITGRLAFIRPDGSKVSGNPRGSCIVVYRAYDLGNTRRQHVRRDDMEKAWKQWQLQEAA